MAKRETADWKDYPFVVKIYTPGKISTGTLVSPRHILTAAHCVAKSDWHPTDRNSVEVVLLSGKKRTGKDIAAIKIPGRSDFRYSASGDAFRNDVAVVCLAKEEELTFGYMDVMDVRDEKKYVSGTVATLIGFGTTHRTILGEEVLYKSEAEFGRIHKVEDSDFYHSSVLATNAEIEPGDSGGPLLAKVETESGKITLRQIGVTSQSHMKDGKYRNGAVLGLGVVTRICDPEIRSWIAGIAGLCNTGL